MKNIKLDVRIELGSELEMPKVTLYSEYGPVCSRFMRALQAVVAALAFAARDSLLNPKTTTAMRPE